MPPLDVTKRADFASGESFWNVNGSTLREDRAFDAGQRSVICGESGMSEQSRKNLVPIIMDLIEDYTQCKISIEKGEKLPYIFLESPIEVKKERIQTSCINQLCNILKVDISNQ